MEKRTTIFATFAVATTYSTLYFYQTTLLPFITKSLAIDTMHFGYLQTVFGIVQLAGGPIFGRFCDHFGANFGFVIAMISCFVCFFTTAIATGFNSMMLSRVVCIFMHGQQTAQTVLARSTAAGQERTEVFGRIGITFGIGFIIGPFLAGQFAKYFGYSNAMMIAAALSLATIPIIFMFIKVPKVLDHPTAEKSAEKSAVPGRNLLAAYWRVLTGERILRLYVIKYLATTPLIIMTSIFGVYLVDKFNVTPAEGAWVGTYIGIWISIMNAFGIVFLRRRFSEKILLLIGSSTLGLTYFCFTQFSEYWHLYLFLPFMPIGQSLITVEIRKMSKNFHFFS